MIGNAQTFQDWASARSFAFTAMMDSDLEVALTAATKAVEAATHRRLEPVAGTLTTYGHGGDLLPLPEEMTAITGVVVAGEAWDSTVWVAQPVQGQPYSVLRGLFGTIWPEDLAVVVTGTLGYKDPLPEDLEEAVHLLAADFLQAGSALVSADRTADVSTNFDWAALRGRAEVLYRDHVRVV